MNVGSAVRLKHQGVVVRVTKIDGNKVEVESPSGERSMFKSKHLELMSLNSLELALAFGKVLDGWTWGGWN